MKILKEQIWTKTITNSSKVHLVNQKNTYILVYFNQDKYIQVRSLQMYYYHYLTYIYRTKKIMIFNKCVESAFRAITAQLV